MCGETSGFFFARACMCWGAGIHGCDPRKWRDFWRVDSMTVYGLETDIVDSDNGPPPVYRKGIIIKRITVRYILVSCFIFQIIISFLLLLFHVVFCVSVKASFCWTDALNRQDRKSVLSTGSMAWLFSFYVSWCLKHTYWSYWEIAHFFRNRKIHCCDRWIQWTTVYLISLRCILILFYHLRVGFPYCSFPSGFFYPKYCINLSSFPYDPHAAPIFSTFGCSHFVIRNEDASNKHFTHFFSISLYFLLEPNIFLSRLFWSVLSVRGQDLHSENKKENYRFCWLNFNLCVFGYQTGIRQILYQMVVGIHLIFSDIHIFVTEYHFDLLVSFLNICTCGVVFICYSRSRVFENVLSADMLWFFPLHEDFFLSSFLVYVL
jgi:hypothetical protein